MIGCVRTRVRKQPIIALYFESAIGLKFYNLEACFKCQDSIAILNIVSDSLPEKKPDHDTTIHNITAENQRLSRSCIGAYFLF